MPSWASQVSWAIAYTGDATKHTLTYYMVAHPFNERLMPETKEILRKHVSITYLFYFFPVLFMGAFTSWLSPQQKIFPLFFSWFCYVLFIFFLLFLVIHNVFILLFHEKIILFFYACSLQGIPYDYTVRLKKQKIPLFSVLSVNMFICPYLFPSFYFSPMIPNVFLFCHGRKSRRLQGILHGHNNVTILHAHHNVNYIGV